jgi:alpha-L-rhamnosidase
VRWRRNAGQLVVEVVVPQGSRAVVDLPGRDPVDVGAGAHRFDCPFRPADSDPDRPPPRTPLLEPES